jgi:hypothetical protein
MADSKGARDVSSSDISEVPLSAINVRYRGQPGQHMLALSLTAFDPTETCASSDFRALQSDHCRSFRGSLISVLMA